MQARRTTGRVSATKRKYEDDDQGEDMDDDGESQGGEGGQGDDNEEVLHCTHPGCLKEFGSRWSLTRHIRTHTGERPFKCADCGKEFVQKCSLKRHEQTHSDRKEWECYHPDCGKKFKLKEYLDVHRRTHMKLDGGKEPGSVSSIPFANGFPMSVGPAAASAGSSSTLSGSGYSMAYIPESRIVAAAVSGRETSSSATSSASAAAAEPIAHVGEDLANVSDVDLDTSGLLFDQLRQRLVRMSVRHREQIFACHIKERETQLKLEECSNALLECVTLLNATIAPQQVPQHIQDSAKKFASFVELEPPPLFIGRRA